MNKILITPKINPDLDGVACAFAYAKLLNSLDKNNKYTPGIYGKPQAEAKFLIEKFNIRNGLKFNPKIKFDKFIMVDASDIKGMPEVIRPQDVIEVIDHRTTHQASILFPNAKIQIEQVGAAATLIFEKMIGLEFPIEASSVYLLLGAIYSNTLNFKSDIVNQRDFQAVNFLSSEAGVTIPEKLIEEMFNYKTEYLLNNLEEVIYNDFKVFENCLGIAQLEGFDLEEIIKSEINKIKTILNTLKNKHNLRYVFLTAADIKSGYNIFVAIDEYSISLLKKTIKLAFNKIGIAKNNKLQLRKQLLPLLNLK